MRTYWLREPGFQRTIHIFIVLEPAKTVFLEKRYTCHPTLLTLVIPPEKVNYSCLP